MKRTLKILLLFIFVQFFSVPADKFEHSPDYLNDSFLALKTDVGVIQSQWEEGKQQPKRKNGSSYSGEDIEECLAFLNKPFYAKSLTILHFFPPVSTSYQGSKLEVLKSRSHPPTFS